MSDEQMKKYRWLLPVQWIYGAGVALRNKLFDWGILPSKSFDVPIICVGNITVGGTGKTPHIEYLIRLLKNQYEVAVLSRGYKRKSRGYILADEKSTADLIGDEPFQMKSKYPEIQVAVDANRCRGVETLCRLKKKEVEVILLDDAFQHRYIQPGLSVLLTDYNRFLMEDELLPVGRLREPVAGKDRAQVVIVTKCPVGLTPIEYNVLTKRLELYPYQQLYFSTFRYGNLLPLFSNETGSSGRNLSTISHEEELLLLTGIASPAPLLEELKKRTDRITLLQYEDHHFFTSDDLKRVADVFHQMDGHSKLIVTTEKDAARLRQMNFSDQELRKAIYILPIEVEILQNKQEFFNQNMLDYVRKNQRNGGLYSE